MPTCRELGIGIVAYSPLSRSVLSDEVMAAAALPADAEDKRASRYPRLSAENLPGNARLVRGVAELAKRRKISTAQLALAWVGNQGDDVCPIPGTTKVAHLDDNVAARDVSLSRAELELIAAAVPVAEVMGQRYAAGAAATYKGNL